MAEAKKAGRKMRPIWNPGDYGLAYVDYITVEKWEEITLDSFRAHHRQALDSTPESGAFRFGRLGDVGPSWYGMGRTRFVAPESPDDEPWNEQTGSGQPGRALLVAFGALCGEGRGNGPRDHVPAGCTSSSRSQSAAKCARTRATSSSKLNGLRRTATADFQRARSVGPVVVMMTGTFATFAFARSLVAAVPSRGPAVTSRRSATPASMAVPASSGETTRTPKPASCRRSVSRIAVSA